MPTTDDVQPGDVRHARDSEGNQGSQSAVKQLSELARELQAEPNMTALMHHIVTATVAEIDSAEHGGISLITGNTVSAVAATNPLVEQLDELQNRIGDGPCLTSLREQVTVRSDDFTAEQRWPYFTAAALDAGVRSMLSVQLFVDGDNLGALNLYATSAHVFDVLDEYTAMAVAAHAAVAMKGSEIESNLRAAVVSRDIIGQGKGILMERYKIGADEAFNLLVLASQHSHLKLREVAEELTRTGEFHTR